MMIAAYASRFIIDSFRTVTLTDLVISVIFCNLSKHAAIGHIHGLKADVVITGCFGIPVICVLLSKEVS